MNEIYMFYAYMNHNEETRGKKSLRKSMYFKRKRSVEKAVIGENSGDGMGVL